MPIDQMNFVIAICTLLGQIFIFAGIIYLLFFRKAQNFLIKFISDNAIALAFFVAVAAVAGSLYYSEIVGLVPCDLCWFQRIFIYPQVVLLGMAWWKKDDKIIPYSLALTGIGIAFSLYHNYIYYGAQPVVNFCSIVSPCTARYIVGLGYITIPLMALTGFLIIFILLLNRTIYLNKNKPLN
jgi:disulfide bond formation protein DsbB